MATPICRAMIWWDTSDMMDEHWSWRIRDIDGYDHSGDWGRLVEQSESGMQDAVVELAYQHGYILTRDDVSVEGLVGEWRT